MAVPLYVRLHIGPAGAHRFRSGEVSANADILFRDSGYIVVYESVYITGPVKEDERNPSVPSVRAGDDDFDPAHLGHSVIHTHRVNVSYVVDIVVRK